MYPHGNNWHQRVTGHDFIYSNPYVDVLWSINNDHKVSILYFEWFCNRNEDRFLPAHANGYRSPSAGTVSFGVIFGSDHARKQSSYHFPDTATYSSKNHNVKFPVFRQKPYRVQQKLTRKIIGRFLSNRL